MNSYKRPVLTIFFQLDPRNPTIGGIQTCIKYVLKYAPAAFRIRLVGITDRATEVGKWQTMRMYGREFVFLPLLQVSDDNVRGIIPTTVKYAWALRQHLKRRTITSDFYQFHRIEPTLFTQTLRGTKILYVHNDIYQEVKGGQKGGILWKRFPWLYFALERRLVSQFNHILSCNSESVKLYQQQYPEIAQRVSYLRNTFDSELFYPPSDGAVSSRPVSSRPVSGSSVSGSSVSGSPVDGKTEARSQLAARLNLPQNTRFVLFAGRLHPQKQPILLAQAMAQLKKQLLSQPATGSAIEPHLIIVGKGELEHKLRQTVSQLGIETSVTFLGSMPQADLAELYRACDLFALTSAYEGLARGSLEALACGTPVVTTRAGETPRFLSADSGIVCDRPTAKGLAQCWQTVLCAPEKFPASACARVAAPYDAKQVVETLYGGLLANWQQQHRRYPDPSDPHTLASATHLNDTQPALADTLPTL